MIYSLAVAVTSEAGAFTFVLYDERPACRGTFSCIRRIVPTGPEQANLQVASQLCQQNDFHYTRMPDQVSRDQAQGEVQMCLLTFGSRNLLAAKFATPLSPQSPTSMTDVPSLRHKL